MGCPFCGSPFSKGKFKNVEIELDYESITFSHKTGELFKENPKSSMTAEKVTPSKIINIIRNWQPEGLFYTQSNNKYIGVDNSTGNAWTEEFDTLDECLKWLEEGE